MPPQITHVPNRGCGRRGFATLSAVTAPPLLQEEGADAVFQGSGFRVQGVTFKLCLNLCGLAQGETMLLFFSNVEREYLVNV